MKLKVTCSVTIFFLLLSIAQAGGWDNSLIGARAIGMGSAFVAVADDASAVFHNPAGLPLCEPSTEILLGGKLYLPKHSYTSPNGRKSESSVSASLPEFFAYQRIGENLALGMGIYTPFAGGGAEWSRSEVGIDLKGYMGSLAFSPTIAYRINPSLSLGVNLNGYYMMKKEEIFNPIVPQGQGQSVDSSESDLAFSGSLGILYRLTEDFSLGLAFRGPADVLTSGETEVDGTEHDSESRFELGSTLASGLAWRMRSNLTLGFEFDYLEWSRLDAIEKTLYYPAPIGDVKEENRLDFTNSYYVKLGCEYGLSERLIMRFGTAYDWAASPKETLSLGNIDVDRFNLLGGVGYSVGGISIDISGFYSMGKETEVPLTLSTAQMPGKFDLDAFGFLGSVSYSP